MTYTNIASILQGVMSSDLATGIMKGVLLLLIVGVGLYLKIKADQEAASQANQQTQTGNAGDQTGTGSSTQPVATGGDAGDNDIDNIHNRPGS